MSKKIRVNRQFDTLQEAADYFNYFLSKNPDADISLTDLAKVAENNGWTWEDQTIGNTQYRTLISDSDGQELCITMRPYFGVYLPDTEDGDPGDDEQPEFEDGDEPEEESEDNNDSEEEESDDSEDSDDAPTTEETFAWVQPGETFVWRDPQDDSEHSAEVVEVKSEDGKVHTTTTEIRAKVEGIDGVISIFCDEIVMVDDDEDDDNGEDEIEDAEIVEDPSDNSEKEDEDR